MKKALLIVMIAVVYSCKTNTETSEVQKLTSEEVKEMVSYLASDKLMGRQTGTPGIDDAATFIENKLKSYGVKPYFETYRDEFTVETSKDTLHAFNVVGYIEGTDPQLKNEFIVVGAHYDHIGFAKMVENDSIANGANDNATGTVAAMAMAKYFAERKNNKRSLIFALFSAEEMGLKGSRHLANKLKSNNIDLYTMVNFEMIGVPLKDRDYKAFVTGFDKSNFSEKVNAYTNTNLTGFSEESKKYRLFMRSDNYAFFNAFNVPSHTISSCDSTNFDHYHQVGDESDIMNFDFTTHLINSVFPALEAMSNTPTREIKLNDMQTNE